MARGWESKEVESQIEAAQAPRESRAAVTHEDQALARKMDGLLLSRTRVMNDLSRCMETRYQDSLRQGLAFLEGELRAMGWQG